MDRESLVLLLEQGLSVEKIGKRSGKHPSTVSYRMSKYGLEAPNREKHAAKGGIDRERLKTMIEAGMTIAEIATAVERSKTTVRHWLRRYQLKTRNKVGPRLGEHAREAKVAGMGQIVFECTRHGERRTYWRAVAITAASAAGASRSPDIDGCSRNCLWQKPVVAAASVATGGAPRLSSSITSIR